MVKSRRVLSISLIICVLIFGCLAKTDSKEKDDDSQKWKKKDIIRDYNDADLERLFEQWEEGDDELEEDELPEWKREPPKVDMSQIDPNDPEGFVKMSKKGRTLMMFATISGGPTEAETEQISSLWHSSLFNAHIDTQRYVVGSDRVLFMLKDGSKAWDVRDFLVKQERCAEVSIEGQNYPGAGAAEDGTSKEPNGAKTDGKKKKKKEEL